MPGPTKPTFTPLDVTSLQQSIEKLDDAVRDVTQRNGAIDVKSLERRIQNDPELQHGVEMIKDAFQREEVRPVTGCGGTPVSTGCNGSPAMRRYEVDPESLEAGEVQTVLQALAEAKSKITGLDRNRDGVLSYAETQGAEELNGLAGEIVEGVVAGSVQTFRSELERWREKVTNLVKNLQERQSFDKKLHEVAAHHAETRLGAEAILWAYRALASRGRMHPPIHHVRYSLKEAETSFLRYVPFFREAAFRRGHLDDKEIGQLFRTTDLRHFIDQKKAEVEARCGGPFETTFLAGKDLDGIEQEKDPDFERVSDGC